VIYKDVEIVNLKHYKDEVTSVEEGKECGISFLQELELVEGDILEGYNPKTQK
jgi:translation initiation factor IF-2